MEAPEVDNEDLRSVTNLDRLIHEPARLAIVSLLYVLESADFLFLMNQTGLTFGNLSSHISKLEAAGYLDVTKTFLGKKPHTTLSMTDEGRAAFDTYCQSMRRVLDGIPGTDGPPGH